MTGAIECRYYGRDFTAEEMALLRALIAGPPALNRHALSKEFCRRIGWLKPDGGLKDMMARVTMLAMHRDGVIVLPPPRRTGTALCPSQPMMASTSQLPASGRPGTSGICYGAKLRIAPAGLAPAGSAASLAAPWQNGVNLLPEDPVLWLLLRRAN